MSMRTDNEALDDLIRDENLGSIVSDDSCAELLDCCFTSPFNESGLQVVVRLQHLEWFHV
jgi:hypothetical protein